MEKLETIMGVLSSPLFDYLIKGFLVYLALLWLALVIWVARDIVNRSNNLLVQVFYILLNLLFPVFGLILYLVLRPQRTLLEKYYDEVEHEFFEEFQEQSSQKPKRAASSPSPENKAPKKARKKTSSKKKTSTKKTS